ncbi:hypothetical protein V1639_04255 [Pseudarthrobacter sp. J75]|uniref:hypothetical protein n=1 Tax=unclassified Pseudarthrobacter TaxID=2647000 RepID=UPI002E80220B|nr:MULTISPECIES: hypothetical protein [unclassified Pseudarthrobacter]MEE2523987.1 hypothetical protein [Pseudarthrobacter sp. J47]MEE2528245.1 hypothetical protein [Pseudarthrobacter sp. J75]
MTEAQDKNMISRRRVTQGAAWSLPVIAAAIAAPSATASVIPPTCPDCFAPGAIPLPFTSQVVVAGNTGTLAIVSTVNVNSSGCDVSLFQPAYTAVMTGATLTMSNGSTYNSSLGLGTGVGSFGSISAFNMNAVFSGINFPNGGSVISGYPVRPTRLCVNFNMILVGLPSLIEIQCPVTLCWNITSTATGVVAFGAGTLNFTGTFSPA